MCGIAGVMMMEASGHVSDECIVRMLSVMARRGPDGKGQWISNGISLGHVRLSIIDLTDAASQPMIDEEAGIVLTFNGEIYNYVELRVELTKLGHRFRTQSDTEVLMKAYLEWGLRCFSRFVGMWAIALFEIRTHRLILSRDRFGIKPLYYLLKDKMLVFASTIEAICSANDGSPTLNGHTVQAYLLNGEVDAGDETFFDGITRFQSGCYAVIEQGKHKASCRYERYWDAGNFLVEAKQVLSFEETQAVFREKLEESVRIHTRSDVDVASCLSGGLDSSSIVSLLATIPEGASINKVFTAVFPGKRFDEGYYSTAVANRYNLKQCRIYPTTQSFLADIDKVIQAQEEPFGSTGVYVQWKVFEEIKKHGIKVVLDGQGADEYLGGYFSFLFPYALDCLVHLQPARAAWAMHSYFQGNSFLPYVSQNFPGLLQRLFGLRRTMAQSSFSAYLSDEFRVDSFQPGAIEKEFMGFGLKKTLARYLTRYSLPSLLRYEDRNSMYFSIESRVPFLDHRLVEFALSMPTVYLINGRWTKRILRESIKDVVPAEVVNRRDKIGFGNPGDEWVESLITTGVFHDLLADPKAKDFLDVPKFSSALGDRRQSKLDYNYFFRVYCLLAWQRGLSR